ncbi:hypothetical protein GGR54DRAFT_161008 [Hypoxylon sp. NC1633]|nr:hypothetical protein GGR54DRAFT_161008 [Hypoxylon sp. NC1633]
MQLDLSAFEIPDPPHKGRKNLRFPSEASSSYVDKMASCHATPGQPSGSGSSPGGMVWRPAANQQYPPPEALPDYLNRALPRRPVSNTSSVYDTADEDPEQQQATLRSQLLPVRQAQAQTQIQTQNEPQTQTDRLSSGSAGILDEAGLALVKPLQPGHVRQTSQSQSQLQSDLHFRSSSGSSSQQQQQEQQQQQQQEIAAPQPRYPARRFLDKGAAGDGDEYVVSPLSAGDWGRMRNGGGGNIDSSFDDNGGSGDGNGMNNGDTASQGQQYEVSPISPDGSARSFRSVAVSASGSSASGAMRNSGSSSMAGDVAAASAAGAGTGTSGGGGGLRLSKTQRRRGLYGERMVHAAYSSGDLARPPGSGVGVGVGGSGLVLEQINMRYSDPGSPISFAVIHPPTSFPSDPNLQSLRHSSASSSSTSSFPLQRGRGRGASSSSSHHLVSGATTKLPSSPNQGSATVTAPALQTIPSPDLLSPENGSGGGGGVQSLAKVSFAGPRSDGFSTRAGAGTGRARPPPLKLSERAIADSYVKTPFPALVEEGVARSSWDERGFGEGGVDEEGEEGEGEEEEKDDDDDGGERNKGGGDTIDEGEEEEGEQEKEEEKKKEEENIPVGKDKEREKERAIETGTGTPRAIEKTKADRGNDRSNSSGSSSAAKKRNRVSSLPSFGFGFAKSLRRATSLHGGGGSRGRGKRGGERRLKGRFALVSRYRVNERFRAWP